MACRTAYGRYKSQMGPTWSFVITAIVLTPFTALGLWLVLRQRQLPASIRGRIVESVCDKYTCNLTYTYTLPGDGEAPRTKSESAFTNHGKVQDVVTLYYHPRDPPGTMTVSGDDYRWAGAVVLALVVVVLVCWRLYWYFLPRSRTFAAAVGTMDVLY